LLKTLLDEEFEQDTKATRATLAGSVDWPDPTLLETHTWILLAELAFAYSKDAGPYLRHGSNARSTGDALRMSYRSGADLPDGVARVAMIAEAIERQDADTTRLEKSGISLRHVADGYIDRLRQSGVPKAFLADNRGDVWLALKIAAEAIYFERKTGDPAKLPTRQTGTGKYHGDFLEHLRLIVPLDAAEDGVPAPSDATLVNKIKTTLPELSRLRRQTNRHQF
jgi:hypothetical protein